MKKLFIDPVQLLDLSTYVDDLHINNIDVQIIVLSPPKFCYTFECYTLLFALAFMDCQFQWEIRFPQISRQHFRVIFKWLLNIKQHNTWGEIDKNTNSNTNINTQA